MTGATSRGYTASRLVPCPPRVGGAAGWAADREESSWGGGAVPGRGAERLQPVHATINRVDSATCLADMAVHLECLRHRSLARSDRMTYQGPCPPPLGLQAPARPCRQLAVARPDRTPFSSTRTPARLAFRGLRPATREDVDARELRSRIPASVPHCRTGRRHPQRTACSVPGDGACAGAAARERSSTGARGVSPARHATAAWRRGAAQPQGNAEVSWTGGAAVRSGLVKTTDLPVVASVTVTFKPTLVPAE